MPVPEWHPAARIDLLSIIDYVSGDNPDAAQHLKDDIEARVAALPEHPHLYRPGREPGTREMVVRSNYVVVYAADVRAVTILRVLHAASHGPGAALTGPWRSARPSRPARRPALLVG